MKNLLLSFSIAFPKMKKVLYFANVRLLTAINYGFLVHCHSYVYSNCQLHNEIKSIAAMETVSMNGLKDITNLKALYHIHLEPSRKTLSCSNMKGRASETKIFQYRNQYVFVFSQVFENKVRRLVLFNCSFDVCLKAYKRKTMKNFKLFCCISLCKIYKNILSTTLLKILKPNRDTECRLIHFLLSRLNQP